MSGRSEFSAFTFFSKQSVYSLLKFKGRANFLGLTFEGIFGAIYYFLATTTIEGTIAGKIIAGFITLEFEREGQTISLTFFSKIYFYFKGRSYSKPSPSESELFGSTRVIFELSQIYLCISLRTSPKLTCEPEAYTLATFICVFLCCDLLSFCLFLNTILVIFFLALKEYSEKR